MNALKASGGERMADSNITKRALANAMKALMQEKPFEKINVAHICERCGMNRKSFYYHFKDKYDLVNWIFDTEIIELISEEQAAKPYPERLEFIEDTCMYFYQNRFFYQKAFQIKGQNSFSDHFREFIQPLMKLRIAYLFGENNVDEFFMNFFVDAVLCTLERWLTSKECMPPKEFVSKLTQVVVLSAGAIQREFPE